MAYQSTGRSCHTTLEQCPSDGTQLENASSPGFKPFVYLIAEFSRAKRAQPSTMDKKIW